MSRWCLIGLAGAWLLVLAGAAAARLDERAPFEPGRGSVATTPGDPAPLQFVEKDKDKDKDKDKKEDKEKEKKEDDKEAVQTLVKNLNHKDPKVRDDALASVVKLGAAAVPHLVDAVKGNDEGLKKAAGEALKKIDPEAAKKAGVR
jgi:HEAT repeat protein